MSILIDILLDSIRNEFEKKEPSWQLSSLTEEDMHFLKKECMQDSEFDPSNKRKTMFEDLVKGKAPVVLASCPYGQVTAVFEHPKQIEEVPWGLWARIFRLYSEKKRGKPFKVYFLANTKRRYFPPGKQEITPENINGGYTYPCNRETILIYRAEDATRVILHELMHSCCLDKHENGVDQVEAETEAWAEAVYVAFLSEGDPVRFQGLLDRQSNWMLSQNEEVKKHMKNLTSKEFPWRYTLGKEEVWRRWGLFETKRASRVAIKNSLRLTFPVDNAIKKRFQVKESSTIL
uniref:Peptidase n=1 Tax=viral metagenome TaxID=1070528 RepID=A0A6C0KQY2_9ZZZZ